MKSIKNKTILSSNELIIIKGGTSDFIIEDDIIGF